MAWSSIGGYDGLVIEPLEPTPQQPGFHDALLFPFFHDKSHQRAFEKMADFIQKCLQCLGLRSWAGLCRCFWQGLEFAFCNKSRVLVFTHIDVFLACLQR